MVQIDLTTHEVIFDDNHAHLESPGNKPKGIMDTTEGGNLDRSIPPQKDNKINFDKMTYSSQFEVE